jgi:hypothetical protein
MLPDFDRAARIGEFWASPETRSFGELLIDLEEDRFARALVVGMVREHQNVDRRRRVALLSPRQRLSKAKMRTSFCFARARQT